MLFSTIHLKIIYSVRQLGQLVLGVLCSVAEREAGVFVPCEASRSLSVDFHGAVD